jgi:hypothetical protein
MTGFTEAQTILDAATNAIVGIPAVTTENERLKTSPITSFTRTTLAPAETITESIGTCGTDRLNGVYVVDMFYPKDDGVAEPNADVDLVTVAFESGTILIDGSDQVEIFNSYPIGSTPDLEKFYRKQVIVEWRARRARTV